MKRHIHRISKTLFVLLVIYLVVLAGGFFGIRYGLTNTAGIEDTQKKSFENNIKTINEIESIEKSSSVADKNIELAKIKNRNYCAIDVIGRFTPVNAEKIAETYAKTNSDGLIAKMIFAVQLRLQDNAQFNAEISTCSGQSNLTLESLQEKYKNSQGTNIFPWMNDEEWKSIANATLKDRDAILKAGEKIGVYPRLLLSCMIVEQVRLFHSQRELFKKVFEPLKILGNANKISLGVMGIKEATAAQIESHLTDVNSPYYLGKDFEHSLDAITGSSFDRLTSEKDNHYNSYLYGALYLKQMMNQWKNAGYDIKFRPEIVGTLFNVGFPQSKPNPNPKVGGSAINVGTGKYSFGSLAYEFYYSGEMQDEFPYITN
jgi:hypothetical protein